MPPHSDTCELRCGDGRSSRAEEGLLSEFGHRQRQDHLPSSERPLPHSSPKTRLHRRGFTSIAMRIQAAAAVAILCSVPEASSMSFQLHAKTTLMAPESPRCLQRGGLGRSAAFAALPSTPTVRWCGGITAPGWEGGLAADKNPSALKSCPRVRGGRKAAARLRMQEQPVLGDSDQPIMKLPASRLIPPPASRLVPPHHPTGRPRSFFSFGTPELCTRGDPQSLKP